MTQTKSEGELSNGSADVFDRLMLQLHERVRSMPEGSYTTSLLTRGPSAIFAKLREECEELIAAAGETNDVSNQHLVHEACDLLFHAWVLLASRGVVVDDLRRELERREGVSGLVEKRNRTKGTP